MEKRTLKEKLLETGAQWETSERMKYELLQQLEQVKRELSDFRVEFQQDQETSKTLKEVGYPSINLSITAASFVLLYYLPKSIPYNLFFIL